MKITVYTITWNEEFFLPYFFDHYSFADKIVVYDNDSTDNTQNLVRKLGGELRYYHTNNKQDNLAMLKVKNNCWKGDDSNWVIVCDIDEFLSVHKMLYYNYTEPVVFKSQGWQMVGEGQPLELIKKGFKDDVYSKTVCFSPAIKEINFVPGCHASNPIGGRVISGMNLLHYNMLGEDLFVQRRKKYVHRRSKSDKDHNFAIHYLYPEPKQRQIYREALAKAVNIK